MSKNRLTILAAGLYIWLNLYACDISANLPLRNNPPARSSSGGESVAEDESATHSDSEEARLRKEIVAYAKKQLGKPYKYAGKDPKGFDCSGLTGYVMKKFDIQLSGSSRTQVNDGKKVKIDESQPGDLIFFKRSPDSEIFHVAMVVANSDKGIEVIHSTQRGVVVDNITNNDYWAPKIFAARNVVP
ncbi:MAG TPA: C40 family peptidase [Saprospiraceae bacterium]|nr:C40 family peptidase [Saprospiraceae bacterium]HMQ84702.1 C40 family peptidase [Saprospiraceae bacterium]